MGMLNTTGPDAGQQHTQKCGNFAEAGAGAKFYCPHALDDGNLLAPYLYCIADQ